MAKVKLSVGQQIGTLIDTGKPVNVTKSEKTTFEFEGIYQFDNPNEGELVYTTRRKGSVYFNVTKNNYIQKVVIKNDELYKAFEKIKKGTVIGASFNFKDK